MGIVAGERSKGRTKTWRAGSASRRLAEDIRPELGETLEPYARFDKDIDKFCCRGCGYQAVRYKGMEAHLVECEGNDGTNALQSK